MTGSTAETTVFKGNDAALVGTGGTGGGADTAEPDTSWVSGRCVLSGDERQTVSSWVACAVSAAGVLVSSGVGSMAADVWTVRGGSGIIWRAVGEESCGAASSAAAAGRDESSGSAEGV